MFSAVGLRCGKVVPVSDVCIRLAQQAERDQLLRMREPCGPKFPPRTCPGNGSMDAEGYRRKLAGKIRDPQRPLFASDMRLEYVNDVINLASSCCFRSYNRSVLKLVHGMRTTLPTV